VIAGVLRGAVVADGDRPGRLRDDLLHLQRGSAADLGRAAVVGQLVPNAVEALHRRIVADEVIAHRIVLPGAEIDHVAAGGVGTDVQRRGDRLHFTVGTGGGE